MLGKGLPYMKCCMISSISGLSFVWIGVYMYLMHISLKLVWLIYSRSLISNYWNLLSWSLWMVGHRYKKFLLCVHIKVFVQHTLLKEKMSDLFLKVLYELAWRYICRYRNQKFCMGTSYLTFICLDSMKVANFSWLIWCLCMLWYILLFRK